MLKKILAPELVTANNANENYGIVESLHQIILHIILDEIIIRFSGL
jgi:hypothetical protein